MSSRLLKKVLHEQEEQHLVRGDEDGSDSSNSPGSKIQNPFDLLNDDGEDHDDHGDEDDDGGVEKITELPIAEEQSVLKGSSQAVPTLNKKSKKKKKRRGKEESYSNVEKSATSLDGILEILDLDGKHEVTNVKAYGSSAQQTIPILQVNPKCLNAETELRKIFGSKVVKSFENNKAGGSRNVHGRRGVNKSRKTVLVSPLDHWPRWDGSLSMEFLEARDGKNYFRYVHSPSYAQAQRAFEAAKAIHDLNSIANVLLYNPYHLDSLLTMAEYFRVVGEHQMSADALAKCLYALECAWHPMFSSLKSDGQLKYTHETNRPLFKTLFIHMNNLDRRGCHQSAFEVCKLLLSLDSDDPMGAMFCIDYLALRAEEYRWLEQFSEEYKSDNSLWLFPNFSYSLAICQFYLEQDKMKKDEHAVDAKASATDLLKQALMLHPSVVKKLVAKVPLKDRFWTKMTNHVFFKSDQIGNPSLDHLINIYVERNYVLWRFPDLQKFLRDTSELVISELNNNRSEAQDWACVRKEVFPSDKNEYSHLLVSDFSDRVTSISPEHLQNFMVEPQLHGAIQDHDRIANPNGDGHQFRDVGDRSALAVLLESILPWVNYGPRDDEIMEDENDLPHRNGHPNED